VELEDFVRCSVSQAFSWSIVYFVDELVQLVLGKVFEGRAFWQVSAQQTVDLLVAATLVSRVGVGEVDVESQMLGDALMVTELGTVVGWPPFCRPSEMLVDRGWLTAC
jgi:hypothetical protein